MTINWLDLVVIIILALYVFLGLRDGFLKQAVSLFGFVISFIAALYLSRPLGAIVANLIRSGENQVAEVAAGVEHLVGLESVLSVFVFFVLFIALQFVMKIVANKLKLVNYIPLVGQFNRLGGVLLGGLKGLIFVFILITIFSSLPPEYLGEALNESAFVNTFYSVFPNLLPYIEEFFLEHYQVLMENKL